MKQEFNLCVWGKHFWGSQFTQPRTAKPRLVFSSTLTMFNSTLHYFSSPPTEVRPMWYLFTASSGIINAFLKWKQRTSNITGFTLCLHKLTNFQRFTFCNKSPQLSTQPLILTGLCLLNEKASIQPLSIHYLLSPEIIHDKVFFNIDTVRPVLWSKCFST